MRRRSHSELFLYEEMDGQERVKKKKEREEESVYGKKEMRQNGRRLQPTKMTGLQEMLPKNFLSRGINLHVSCKPPPFIPT